MVNKEKSNELVNQLDRISLLKPLELEYTYGCLDNSLSVNNVEEIDLTDKEVEL